MRAGRVIGVSAAELGAALIASSASAQVVSRSINEEPVETIVTQTPNGTVVTRRPIGGEAVYGQPPASVVVTSPRPYAAPSPYAAPAVVEAVPNTVDAITTREVVL